MTDPCRVLVIDDDPDVLDVVRMVLEEDGHLVATASDGQEALLLLQQGDPPHLILLDLRMPGMDGWTFEAERKKAALAPEAALVVISSEPLSVSQLLSPARVLRKPLDAGRVAETAKAYCPHR